MNINIHSCFENVTSSATIYSLMCMCCVALCERCLLYKILSACSSTILQYVLWNPFIEIHSLKSRFQSVELYFIFFTFFTPFTAGAYASLPILPIVYFDSNRIVCVSFSLSLSSTCFFIQSSCCYYTLFRFRATHSHTNSKQITAVSIFMYA